MRFMTNPTSPVLLLFPAISDRCSPVTPGYHFFMTGSTFESREGGVKIVFDVPADVVADAELRLTAAGFAVRPYYSADSEHRPGTAELGWVRLGAERPMRDFTDAEQHGVIADFDAAIAESTLTHRRIGTDVWTAGGGPRRT
jgi:hypothetical protein